MDLRGADNTSVRERDFQYVSGLYKPDKFRLPLLRFHRQYSVLLSYFTSAQRSLIAVGKSVPLENVTLAVRVLSAVIVVGRVGIVTPVV